MVAGGMARGAPVPAAGTTWHVDGMNGSDQTGNGSAASPFKTIQFTIARPETIPGDRVLVLPATYHEKVDYLNKAITLEARDGPDVTIIQPSQQVDIVVKMYGYPSPAYPKLEGFTVSAPAGAYIGCILIANGHVRGCVVRDNVLPVNGFRAGIYVAYNAIVSNSTMVNNGVGVLMASHQGPLILFNSIAWANGQDVVAVQNSHPARVGYCAGLANSTGLAPNPTNIVGNPQLTASFHLQPGSPCIGAARGGGDIGAFQF